jgi:hypothetical protein
MNYNVVVEPQPGAQSLALSCPANEILFEGTRGSSKTATQLMRFRRLVGIGYGEFWRGVIFDLEYKNLADIIAQSKKLYNKFNDGARFLASNSELRWVWPTGEELMFRYAKSEDDYWAYHGSELPFIGYNELTKRADDKFYLSMFSCMRSSFRPKDYPLPDGSLLPKIPLECFSTTNPFGAGHNWIKKRFIDPVPRGTIQREKMTIDLDDGNDPEEVELTRVAIHGSWKENKYLDKTYIAYLLSIKDPSKRAAWVDGDWTVNSGGRFNWIWQESEHVVPSFDIPQTWAVDRAHDWGESKPFSNLWFAESDGITPADINGHKKLFCKGSIFMIAEYYGCPPNEDNKGINMTSTNVARWVKQVDDSLLSGIAMDSAPEGQLNMVPGMISDKVKPGPADGSIYNTPDDQISIADKMALQGVKWVPADKRPGSRVNGAQLICDLLEASIEAKTTQSGMGERPGVYIMEHCRGFISRFPGLARDTKNPDDIDTDQEDHDYDAFRYRCMNVRFEPVTNINIQFAI